MHHGGALCVLPASILTTSRRPYRRPVRSMKGRPRGIGFSFPTGMAPVHEVAPRCPPEQGRQGSVVLSVPMLEIAIALIVGFALGYGVREWVSRRRRQAARERRSEERRVGSGV